ncbi:MAG TPA: iron-containing redox enzyme family protein [Candidatus Saccharimonadales bacterium]|nr:iron-containing redox enzyme family protein [Candidatus Saccharimonadales bacterium]
MNIIEKKMRQAQAASEALLASKPILSNPYFSQLRDGQLEKGTFIRTQCQFLHAVRFFPRAMAALTMRLPDSASRRGLILNLAEEHGCDAQQKSFNPAMAHDQTFMDFLAKLGVASSTVEVEKPPVQAFNLALLGACQTEPIPTAFACLGIIEYAFADISAFIGSAVVQRGWISSGELVHYNLHSKIDKQHAAEFLESSEQAWEAGGTARRSVEQGLALGLYLFDQLYRNLLTAA